MLFVVTLTGLLALYREILNPLLSMDLANLFRISKLVAACCTVRPLHPLDK